MGLATFLFYVTLSTHGYSEIHVVPMPNMQVCNEVKNHMMNDISYKQDTSFFNNDKRLEVMPPRVPECKEF